MLVNGLFIAVTTELLSLFRMIGYRPVLASWSLFLAFLLFLRGRHKEAPPRQLPTLTSVQWGLLAALSLLGGVTLVTAVVAAPNNFDSLTYHLPRVLHWIQNGSVRHYPTHIDRQLVLAPWSEFTIMHLQLLSGGDRLSNTVQWMSMVGSAVAASLIAARLKGSVNAQIVAAVVAVSVPMGLLQSTSTQNDYTASFWIILLVYYIFEATEGFRRRTAVMAAAALALAVLTKGTAYLIAAPFMSYYLLQLALRKKRDALEAAAIAAVMLLLVNGAHYARNYAVYGNPLTPGTGNDIVCRRVDPATLVSTVSKNIATQLATGSESANALLFRTAAAVHEVLGVSLDDADLTSGTFVLPKARVSEDFAPNPLHMLLLLGSAATLVLLRKEYDRQVKLGLLMVWLSFIALSLGVQWNFFVSRYFLPVFILSAPFVALVFDRVRMRTAASCVAATLVVMSAFILANHETRPLVGPKSVLVTSREDQYFVHRPQAKAYFRSMTDMIKASPVQNVGILDRDGNMWEYLLWVLLQEGNRSYRIEHVGVTNSSGKIRLERFQDYIPVNI